VLYTKDMLDRKPVRFLLSLVIVTVAAGIGGAVTYPSIQGWYAELDKPFFNPPNWVFGPVWALLYFLMAVSLYLVWSARTKRSRRLAFWAFGGQLALNVAWSAVFFGLHQLWLAVGVVLALWLAIALTIGAFWRIQRIAAYILIPYLAWVTFASALTISVALLNAGSEANDYKACTRATGSTLQLSYPEVCVTPDGRRFPNPDAPVDFHVLDSLRIPE